MALKKRFTWMQVHVYFACFFLPITLLYIASGVLYLFEIEGKNKAEHHYAISLSDGWPKDAAETKQLVLPVLKAHGHNGELPSDFYHEKNYVGWYGYKQQVFLDPTQSISGATVTVIEHDFLQQCLLIHKGHAGLLFWLFAIMLGGSLVLSAITGVVLAFSMPKLVRSAILCSILGVAAVVLGFALTQ